MSANVLVDELSATLRAVGQAKRDVVARVDAALPASCLGALYVLARGDRRVGDLARVLQVDASVASRQAATLQDLGYVTRVPDPDDRRAHLLAVTDDGHGLVARLHDEMTRAFEDAFPDWTDHDFAEAARALGDVRTGLARLVGADPPAAMAGTAEPRVRLH